MSSSAIVSALTSLLPSLPASKKPFPPVLVSQCESLLALSRQRASNLKPEEEIARAHACSEIACTKLRAQLRLPAIKNGAGAPCQPRVYAKLINFLENTLRDVNAGSLTPRGRKRDGDGNVKDTPIATSVTKGDSVTPRRRSMHIDDTPSKKRTVRKEAGAAFAGTVQSTRKSRTSASTDDKAPSFVMPSIRQLCKTFSTPTLAPHVYTGTCIVLERAGIWSSETTEIEEDNAKADILALVIALYLMVLTRMREGSMTTDIYTDVTERCVEVLQLGNKGAESVEIWINKLNEGGWCNGEEWWDSVPESVFVFDPHINVIEQDEGSTKNISATQDTPRFSTAPSKRVDISQDDPENVLLPGLGTMLHDGIDWTSEEKCQDYKEWHTRIIRQLRLSAKAGAKKSKAVVLS